MELRRGGASIRHERVACFPFVVGDFKKRTDRFPRLRVDEPSELLLIHSKGRKSFYNILARDPRSLRCAQQADTTGDDYGDRTQNSNKEGSSL